MFNLRFTSFLCLSLLLVVVDRVSTNTEYASAIIESCKGCALNRMPEVKEFIFEDVPKYENVEFKHIQGAMPELVLFNDKDEEVERLKLSELNRDQCNKLLVSKGFNKRENSKDEM